MFKPNKFLVLVLVLMFSLVAVVGCGGQTDKKEQPQGEKAPEKTEKQIVIKLAHPNVPTHPMGQAFIKFKEDLEKKSNGRFKVDIYDSSKWGNYDQVVQGLQTNMLQMGSDSTPNLQPFSDDFLIFDMPFLFPSYESADKITDGEIGKRMAKSLESSNIMGLGFIEIGFRHVFNGKKPVATLEDYQGLKIRSTASKAHIATLKSLGANPTPIAWGECYTSLQQGTVDGIDIDLNLGYFNKFHEVQGNLTLVGSLYSPHLVMISKVFFEGLSPEDQKLVKETFEEMKLYERNLIRSNEKMIVEKIKESGVKVIELSDEERAKWAEASKGVYEQFQDKVSKEYVEEVRKIINN